MFIALLLVTFSDCFCTIFQIQHYEAIIAPFLWLAFLLFGLLTVCCSNLLSWKGMRLGTVLCLGIDLQLRDVIIANVRIIIVQIVVFSIIG